jgi:hypothetical protein
MKNEHFAFYASSFLFWGKHGVQKALGADNEFRMFR